MVRKVSLNVVGCMDIAQWGADHFGEAQSRCLSLDNVDDLGHLEAQDDSCSGHAHQPTHEKQMQGAATRYMLSNMRMAAAAPKQRGSTPYAE